MKDRGNNSGGLSTIEAMLSRRPINQGREVILL